ncbi:U3 small nucleolar RNA-associated protein 15 homolog [Acanthaster planci]|uniref:U3 small nucleolar RNA-associated protein 15 homolog n=1 Tax=Acanthaster planci TaxID=133434 RepID=A0A8B7ZZ20_ACAPL|nr:U3 small nucleolar RNA-associated protein 15 homolog [Acanthaster planci]XP_022110347.1 U3 small nucleolar RNA-associated protein 15 homolog [Acanthaster planci]
MASDYKKVVVRTVPRGDAEVSKETQFWKNFEFPVTVKEFGAVTCVDFNPQKPHQFAVTSSTRVQIFDPLTNQVEKTLSRFQDVAYSATYRADGKLLVAGGEEKSIRLFDVNGRAILRIFKGHSGPVHVTKFGTDNLHIMSCSDDKSVRCWDIPSEMETRRYDEHADYVRCGTVSTASKDIWLTGSYDHKVKLFDLRTQASVLTLDHGHPVESVLMFPGGGMFLSSGGNCVKVWDALAGGKLLAAVSNHHKTITSMCFNGARNRLLTASIDRHVKVYDVASYKLVASLDYPAPILSMGVSPTDSTVVVGMSSGLISIRHRKPEPGDAEKTKRKLKLSRVSHRYYDRGHKVYTAQKGDIVVKKDPRDFLQKYDTMLKRFEHSKALDAALKTSVRIKTPEVTVSVLQELVRRGVIKRALAGRDEKWLRIMIAFLKKHITNPNFAGTVIDITNMLLDIYTPVIGESEELVSHFRRLKITLDKELQYHRTLQEIKGMLDTVLAASQTVDHGTREDLAAANTEIPTERTERSGMAVPMES